MPNWGYKVSQPTNPFEWDWFKTKLKEQAYDITRLP